MKRLLLISTLVIVCNCSEAQYKKASFLNKSGRTYDLGGTAHLLSEGRSMTPGFFYSYGKDKGKRLFHWFDLELLLPIKADFTTTDRTSKETVNVTAKSGVSLIYRYNLGCYLLNTSEEAVKLKPFVTAGVNLLLSGGFAKEWTTNPEYADTPETLAPRSFGYGANAGIGLMYNITEKFGLKAAAGYNYQSYVDDKTTWDGGKPYFLYNSHPYVSVGVRFTMESDD